MLAVAHTGDALFGRGMATPPRHPPRLNEPQRLGLALKRLRQRADLSQKAAAEAANTYQQTWARYEGGVNDALLRVNLQRRLAEALGFSHEDFLQEADAVSHGLPPQPVPPPGRNRSDLEFELHGQVRASPQGFQVYDTQDARTVDLSRVLGAGVRFLPVAGESMIPYAYPGGLVSYDRDGVCSRGLGCVIETTEGQFYLKLYKGESEGKLHVTELFPEERELVFDMKDLRGVYPVGIRLDRT